MARKPEKRRFMKSLGKLIGAGVLMAAMATAMYAKDKDEESSSSNEVKRVNSAATVLDEIMAAPDKGIPKDVLESAKCIAVVPSMIKGGFIVGARYGKGVATCHTAKGWSAPAPIRIEGGSWGLQFGGEAVDLVMLVMNDKGMDHLLSSKFKLGAEGSAAAGPVGRQAEANTDWKMRAEVLSYSRARGIFAGLELNGAVIKQDDDDTRLLYGKAEPFRDILSGRVSAPEGTHRFLATITKYSEEARQERGEMQTPKEKREPTTPNHQ
jgi:lipid-binding SYLF domain-containing protein